jgi:hypothetical protein
MNPDEEEDENDSPMSTAAEDNAETKAGVASNKG